MTDIGTSFQLAEVVKVGSGLPSSKACLGALQKRWFAWVGHPVQLMCDRGLHNRGVVQRYMDEVGVQVHHVALESPESRGRRSRPPTVDQIQEGMTVYAHEPPPSRRGQARRLITRSRLVGWTWFGGVDGSPILDTRQNLGADSFQGEGFSIGKGASSDQVNNSTSRTPATIRAMIPPISFLLRINRKDKEFRHSLRLRLGNVDQSSMISIANTDTANLTIHSFELDRESHCLPGRKLSASKAPMRLWSLVVTCRLKCSKCSSACVDSRQFFLVSGSWTAVSG